MKLKKTCILLTAIIFFLVINAAQLKAQDGPGSPCGDPDLDCPIDGGVIFLVAAVLFLSVKNITEAKRFSNKNFEAV